MVLRLEDELREDAVGAVRTLQTLGVYVAMLTGDERKAAEAVAQTLGIEERLVNGGWDAAVLDDRETIRNYKVISN